MSIFTSISSATSSVLGTVDKSFSGINSTLDRYAREQHEKNIAHLKATSERELTFIIAELNRADVLKAEVKARCANDGTNYDKLEAKAMSLLTQEVEE